MPKQIIIAEQHQIAAVFWEDQIQELVVSTGAQQVGDIYLGIVENVIPGIDAAFVNIGDTEKNGFIHVTDLGPIRLKRNSSSITELLEPQQKALVQVMKEPTGNKGPRLTGNITLPGRYVVLMPYSKGVNLSRRITTESERNRLRALAVLMKPPGMGLLVRTEAEGTDEEAIIEDLEQLQKQWESIQQQANYGRPPMLINRDDDFIQRVLRDMYSDDVNRIVVDSASAVKRVKNQLLNWQGGKSLDGILIDHHREKQSILNYFRVNAAIREALKPRVELPSGGYIIIEPTEALTVIDVNSGSFTQSATARETVLWTNYEAATEIARQLRLRNIGGVIVVDFIDMDSRHDQLKLLEHFTGILKADKARPQIAQLSELGLVELTRKRQGQNIYELFGRPCAHCNGLGHLVHLPGEEEAMPLQLNILSSLSSQGGSRTSGESRPILSGRRTTASHGRRLTPRVSRSKLLSGTNTPDTEPLNLIHHPDYQEQGHSRRRRRRPPEPASKPVLRDVKEIREDSGDRPQPQPSTQTREIKGNESGSAPSRYDRRERGRYRRDEPKETIQVEMTDQEKSVYALIGVSPLVRLDPGLKKDPRSTIVQIVSPGSIEKTEDETVATPATTPEAPELSPSTPEVAATPEVPVTPTPDQEAFDTTTESEPNIPEDNSNGRRRRRRRSSVNS